MEKDLRIEEVALIVGVSTKTINTWYQFKREDPDNELAKLLPEPNRVGPHKTRYWKHSQMRDVLKFKESIPIGRLGVMGKVTQKYAKKREEKQNGSD